MRPLPLSFAVLLALPLAAQSPLTTSAVFRASLGASGARSVQVYLDLTVTTALTITGIDSWVLPNFGSSPRLEIFTCPGGWAANVSNPGAWALAGSSRVVLGPCCTALPPSLADEFGVALQPGTVGICLSFSGCLPYLSTNVLLGYGNRDMALQFGGFGYAATAFDPRAGNGAVSCCGATVLDCSIHYQLGGGYAGYRAFGTGCVDQGSAFYEYFAPGTFDLGGSATQTNSIWLIPSGTGGYYVLPGSNGWHTPTSPALPMVAHGLSGPLALGFPFAFPGGSSSSVYLGTNGFVQLEPCAPCGGVLPFGPFVLASDKARLAPMAQGLDINLGGAISFEVDTINQIAYATWDSVPDGAGTPNTFQVAMFANGQVEYRYRACSSSAPGGGEILVGFSPGHDAPEPHAVDLSMAMPFVTVADNHALSLLPGARPVLGSTVNLTTDHVPAASAVGALLLGVAGFDPGLDLTALGMPGCRQFARTDAQVLVPANAPSTVVPLVIPSTTALSGVRVFAQMAVLSAGFNPVGVLASNGLDLRLGW